MKQEPEKMTELLEVDQEIVVEFDWLDKLKEEYRDKESLIDRIENILDKYVESTEAYYGDFVADINYLFGYSDALKNGLCVLDKKLKFVEKKLGDK